VVLLRSRQIALNAASGSGRSGRTAVFKFYELWDNLRALLTYVSRDLTQRTGVTMRTLRDARLLWAYREGLLPALAMTIEEVLFAAQLLDKPVAGARAP